MRTSGSAPSGRGKRQRGRYQKHPSEAQRRVLRGRATQLHPARALPSSAPSPAQLSSCTCCSSPRSAAPGFSTSDKSHTVPLTHLPASLGSSQPWPCSAALPLGTRQGAGERHRDRHRERAPAPSCPPWRLQPRRVKGAERRKRKLVTPEYAQRSVGKHLLNTHPGESLGVVLHRRRSHPASGQPGRARPPGSPASPRVVQEVPGPPHQSFCVFLRGIALLLRQSGLG